MFCAQRHKVDPCRVGLPEGFLWQSILGATIVGTLPIFVQLLK